MTNPPTLETEAWIRFMAPVNQQSATALLKAIDQKITTGVKHLHLMISSPGGSVFHGLSIHNFLRGAPIQVSTYNFGSVDSIGVIIFCSGDKRICVPHARFLIHGVSMGVNANAHFDEKDFEEKLKGLRIDTRNIAKVISDTTGKDIDAVVKDMETRITLNPEEGLSYSLVHEIRKELFPAGADLTVIYEDMTTTQKAAGPAARPVTAQVQNFTAPASEGLTEARFDVGTYFKC